MHSDLCHGHQGLCDSMKPTKGTELLKYLRKVNFTGKNLLRVIKGNIKKDYLDGKRNRNSKSPLVDAFFRIFLKIKSSFLLCYLFYEIKFKNQH